MSQPYSFLGQMTTTRVDPVWSLVFSQVVASLVDHLVSPANTAPGSSHSVGIC